MGGAPLPPRFMVVSAPAKVLRAVSEKGNKWKIRGTAEYQALARAYLADLTPVKPLTAVEAGCPEPQNRHRAIQKARDKPT